MHKKVRFVVKFIIYIMSKKNLYLLRLCVNMYTYIY